MWSNGFRKDFLSTYKWLKAGADGGNWVFPFASNLPHCIFSLTLVVFGLKVSLISLHGRAGWVSLFCYPLNFVWCHLSLLRFLKYHLRSRGQGLVDRKSTVVKKEQGTLESARPWFGFASYQLCGNLGNTSFDLLNPTFLICKMEMGPPISYKSIQTR